MTKAELESEIKKLKNENQSLKNGGSHSSVDKRISKPLVKVKDGYLLIKVKLGVEGIPYQKKNGNIRSKAIAGDLGKRSFFSIGHDHFYDIVVGRKVGAEKWLDHWDIQAQ